MSSEQLEIVSQPVIAVEIDGFDDLDIQLMQWARHRLRTELTNVLSRDKEQVRIHWSDRHDGYVLVCEGKSPVTCLRAVCRDLADQLRHDRRKASETSRLRLRLAVNYGMIAPEDGSWFGAPITQALRMLRAEAVGQALDANPDANLVIVASGQVHNDVIKPGLGPDPDGFREVSVAGGKAGETAWLYLPHGNGAHKSEVQHGNGTHKSEVRRQRWKQVAAGALVATVAVALGVAVATQKWRLEVPDAPQARLPLPVTGKVHVVPTPSPVSTPAPAATQASEPEQRPTLSNVERARERCPAESGEADESTAKEPRGTPSRIETC